MNLIHLLVEMMHITNASWIALCHKTLFPQTRASWEKIGRYMDTYHKKEKPMSTQPWARVINSGFFHDFNASENFNLCAIFAGALECEGENSGIWNAYWVRSRKFEAQEWQVIGQSVRESFISKVENIIGITQESKDIIARASRLKNTNQDPINAPAPHIDDNDL